MPAVDVYEVVLGYSVNGEKCVNVLHYQQTTSDGVDPANLEVARAVANQVWPGIRDASSQDLTLQTVKARRIWPTLGGFHIETVNEAGTIAQDTLPPQNSVVLTLYSNNTERRGRGRINLPGVPDTHNQDGLLPASVVALYTTIGVSLETTLVDAGAASFAPGIWSTTYDEFAAITKHQVRSWIHTVRSRRMTV